MHQLEPQRVIGEIRTWSSELGGNRNLTPREQEIIMHLGKGMRYQEIASTLGIAVSTVRQHAHNLYGKLKVSNKVEALNKWKSILLS